MERVLQPIRRLCPACGQSMRIRYENRRTLVTLSGTQRLRLKIRRCEAEGCARFRKPYRPEAEGALALPQHEFGLDVMALVGALRHREHRSVPEIHAILRDRGVPIAERSVTNLLDRYDEVVSTRLGDPQHLRRQLGGQDRSSSLSTVCSRMSATRCSGCYATVSRGRSCWRAACCRGPRSI